MGILNELVTTYHAKHSDPFSEREDPAAINAKAQDTWVSKKRR